MHMLFIGHCHTAIVYYAGINRHACAVMIGLIGIGIITS
jgi:hypothetical protein